MSACACKNFERALKMMLGNRDGRRYSKKVPAISDNVESCPKTCSSGEAFNLISGGLSKLDSKNWKIGNGMYRLRFLTK